MNMRILGIGVAVAAAVPALACSPTVEARSDAEESGGSPMQHVTRLQPFVGAYDVTMASGGQETEGTLDVFPAVRGRYVEWTFDVAGAESDWQLRLLMAWDQEAGSYRIWRFDSRGPIQPGGNEGRAWFEDDELVMEWMRPGRGGQASLRNRVRMASEDTLVLVTEQELPDGEVHHLVRTTGQRVTGAAGAAGGAGGAGPATRNGARHVTTEEVLLQPTLQPDHRISFGSDPSNFGELRLPDGEGPHPVAILVHGGCWLSFATLRHFDRFAEELTAQGMATWNVAYRKVDEPGGGWPATFLDVAAGVDHVRALAENHDLDLERVFLIGHSAGGHLATWAAARPRIPASSVLHVADPLPVAGVVNLAGPPDLEAVVPMDEQACGANVMEPLVGGSPEDVPEQYAAASPARLLPLGVPQLHLVGAEDEVRPLLEDFARRAGEAGDPVDVVVVPEAGHHDVVAPWSPAWREVRDAITEFVQRNDGG